MRHGRGRGFRTGVQQRRRRPGWRGIRSFPRGRWAPGYGSANTTLSVRLPPRLAIFAVKKVAHGFPSSLVPFAIRCALDGALLALRGWFRRIFGTALRASIGETRLVGFQLKFFRADAADFDRKSHRNSIVDEWIYDS